MPTKEQVLALNRASQDYDEVGLVVRDVLVEGDAVAFRRARQPAPTRPHPHAPTSPAVAVKAAGAAVAAIDRVRDAAGDRGAARRGRAAQDIERSEGPG
jgi:hypothetical protein